MTETYVSALKQKCGNANTEVSVRKLPPYVSYFIQDDRDVIFIYNPVATKLKIQSVDGICPDESFDGDITGQPLEAPYCQFDSMNLTNTMCVATEDCESFGHSPLRVVEARSLLSFCALEVKPSLPVWVLTDSSDLKKSVLLSFEIDGNWITRSWVSDKGSISPPSLEGMQAQHAEFSKCPIHMATCEVKSLYNIKKEALVDDPSLLHKSITLHASWNKMSLEPPLLHRSTEIRLNAKVRIGHETGGLKVIWEQICLLENYLNLLSEINSANNCRVPIMSLPPSDNLLECMNKPATDGSPLSRISSILKEPQKDLSGEDCSQRSLDQLINLYSNSKDPAASITDRLWLLFIECKTYQELSACLKELFMEIKKKNTPAPFLNSSNITRLGRALQGEGGISIHDPIEYLVEIGIEKLKKDFLLIFSKARIATGNCLNIPKFTNFSEISSVDWFPTARKWHLWLSQVHCALEVFWSVQEALNLSSEGLYSIAPNILQNYTGKNSKIDSFANLMENRFQEIEAVIPIKYVENSLLDIPNEEWVFSLTTSTNKRKCQSTFYKTFRNRFCNVSGGINAMMKDMTLTNLSHWYEYRTISDYFL